MSKSLSEIIKLSDNQMVGNECFTLEGKATDLTMLEFWRWHFSEIYDLQSKFAEYIVGKALGLTEAQNVGDWTLFDMMYKGKRIEVKETSYYHAWQTDEEPKSKQRVFGITKAYDNYKDETSPLRRQNDIYIFCLNTGETKESSYPLELNNLNDIPNLNCYGSIRMSFFFYKPSRERLSRPFLIFNLIELK